MNKKRIAIVLSIMTVLLFSIVFFSYGINKDETSHQQTPTPTVKPITNVHITDFHFTNFFPAEGMSWHAGFIIEVTNNETETVDRLTLTFNSESPYNMTRTIGFYNNTSLPNQKYVTIGQSCPLGPLQKGETKLLYGYVQNNFGDYYKIRGLRFQCNIKSW